MRRPLLALVPLAVAALAADAGAQIIRPGMRSQEPTSWVSLGVGLQNGFGLLDGTTNSAWQFSDATQYVVSLEKVLSGGTTLGVRGSHAIVPLYYSGSENTEADANVSQVMGVLHVASGREFHSVLELSAGATLYSNFRSRTTDRRLAPTAVDADFAFAFGYGFGYNFSPRFGIDIVQDVSTSLHQKTGLIAGESSSVRFSATRLVGRVGIGGP